METLDLNNLVKSDGSGTVFSRLDRFYYRKRNILKTVCREFDIHNKTCSVSFLKHRKKVTVTSFFKISE